VYVPGGNLYQIVLGDFNHDTNLDLAVNRHVYALMSESSVAVALGNGTGTFDSMKYYITSDAPESLATGDINGDGHLDLVVGTINKPSGAPPDTTYISVLTGNSDGSFNARADYPVTYPGSTQPKPRGIALGDFNKDGALDIASANYADSTSVFLNGLFHAVLKIKDTSDPVDTTGLRYLATATSTTLAAGAQTSNFIINYTPVLVDVGTKYFQICADQDLTGTGVINENTSEGNNCTEWSPVTIGETPPSCTSFTVTPGVVAVGESVQVAWSCQNATSCDALGTSGFDTGGASSGGPVSVVATTVGDDQHFGVKCFGPGALAPAGKNLYSDAFRVIQPFASIRLEPPRIQIGGSANVVAECDQVESGRVEGFDSTCSIDQATGSDKHFSCSFPALNIGNQRTYWVYCKRFDNEEVIDNKASVRFSVKVSEP
jgi:FG-GAP-like repeat